MASETVKPESVLRIVVSVDGGAQPGRVSTDWPREARVRDEVLELRRPRRLGGGLGADGGPRDVRLRRRPRGRAARAQGESEDRELEHVDGRVDLRGEEKFRMSPRDA